MGNGKTRFFFCYSLRFFCSSLSLCFPVFSLFFFVFCTAVLCVRFVVVASSSSISLLLCVHDNKNGERRQIPVLFFLCNLLLKSSLGDLIRFLNYSRKNWRSAHQTGDTRAHACARCVLHNCFHVFTRKEKMNSVRAVCVCGAIGTTNSYSNSVSYKTNCFLLLASSSSSSSVVRCESSASTTHKLCLTYFGRN